MTDTPAVVDADPHLRRELATARHLHLVHALLENREDLYGVHPLADLVHDAVRWTA
jgi:hypothetical protein